ncbi:MAG: MMPL family transporter [Dehalococcoidia bacterium]|nr:MMPL family transporter [Dehalococcoidia bacterium]
MRRLSLPTESLARSCANHPWLTIGIWVGVLLISLGLISAFLGDATTSEIRFTGNPESKRASELLEQRLTGERKANEVVIITSKTLTVDDAAFREEVQQLYGEIMALGPDVISRGLNYYLIGSNQMVSSDRHTTLITLAMTGNLNDARQNIGKVHRILEQNHSGDQFQVLMTGDASLNHNINEAARKDMQTAEILGIPVALLILLLVFGAVVAALVPLLLAMIAIVIALGIVAVLGQAYEFSTFVTNMIVAMGFALGIDYSLFIVSRYREERSRGREKTDAIVASAATATRAVLFSGITVVLALLGMMIVPITVFTSLAAGSIFVVIVSILTTLTLLPAVLSLVGDRINSLHVPILGRRLDAQAEANKDGLWNAIARSVMKRPLLNLILAAGILIAAIVPLSGFHLGAAGVSSLPDRMESKQAYLILEKDFSFGLVSPARVAIDGDIDSPSVQGGIERLKTMLATDSSFYGTPTLQVNTGRDMAELSCPVVGDPTSEQAIDAVRKLRADYIPEAFNGVDAEVLVTGKTAGNIDYVDITGNYLPIVLIFVLILSFVFLTVVFHSIVIPLTSILMNLLAVGATYGLVVLVFQKGFGAGVLGLQSIDKFEAWVPIFLFCILFGLSMDYNVFLLSRIRERYELTGDNAESVAFGLSSTGSIITGAAFIMVAILAAFASGDLVMLQQLGFGMAVAVFLDATIVRCILVPSIMQLLGTRNWYLPGVLKWIPQVRLRE